MEKRKNKKRRKRWTAEEVGYLRRNFSHKGLDTLAKELSRPVSSVKVAAHALGLIRDE
jgi:hypothetical protein